MRLLLAILRQGGGMRIFRRLLAGALVVCCAAALIAVGDRLLHSESRAEQWDHTVVRRSDATAPQRTTHRPGTVLRPRPVRTSPDPGTVRPGNTGASELPGRPPARAGTPDDDRGPDAEGDPDDDDDRDDPNDPDGADSDED